MSTTKLGKTVYSHHRMLELDENLAYRMSMVAFALGKAVASIHAAEGLTIHQWKVLSIVCHRAPLRASQIEPLVTLDKSAISRNVQALVKQGLVKLRTTSNDARAFDIEPTGKGRKLHETVAKRILQLQTTVLSGLPDADVRTLFRALRHIEDRLGCPR